MTAIKQGDTVAIHYTGTLTDGTVFDSSEGRDPLEFTVGVGHVIAGLDAALMGMAQGDQKVVDIPSDQAYGPVREGGRQDVPRSFFPDTVPLTEGGQVQMQTKDGQVLLMQVVTIGEETVVLDANHPLAGKDLRFDFTIVRID